jgi:hypothetical protein
VAFREILDLFKRCLPATVNICFPRLKKYVLRCFRTFNDIIQKTLDLRGEEQVIP